MKLVTAAEMRELEQAAIAAGNSERQLMEEAGLAVAQEAWMMLGTLDARRILVLAGPGNNGGDGLVAARHLADWGAEVAVVAPLGREPDEHSQELEQRQVTVENAQSEEGLAYTGQLLQGCEMVIDALLGIGQTRAVDSDSPLGQTLRMLGEARRIQPAPKLIAVDIPTGINADSGAADPLAVPPDITVTFGLPKVGMYQADTELVGRVQVIDIGIPRDAMENVPLELLTSRWMRETYPARPEESNKGTFGKVLVLAGSRNFAGAPLLTARGAYRAGAGLVTVACPEPVYEIGAASLTEATWLPQPAASDGTVRADIAVALRNEWKDYAAAVFGPGLGNTTETQSLTWAALPDMGKVANGVVIDADGLNALVTLEDGADRVPANAVLTPHPGEMARLVGKSVAEVQAARLETAREAAQRFGCVVVLKGAHSVVADAQGRARLSPFANPLLASAGTGDVLAGMIAGYLAQGMAPPDAAALGVYVHAASGESIRQRYGDAGLLASELADEVPRAVNELRG